jgi:hypothetical protein
MMIWDGEVFGARGFTHEITCDRVAVALGDNYFGGAIALSVELVESIVDFKPNPVRMGMLTVPFIFPATPIAARLKMNQLTGFWIGFKSTMSVAQIGVRQCEGGNDLPTVGTLNFWAKNGMLKGKVHVSSAEETAER